jgi:diadenosine tetraphosphate (Ap4A) HIT family hydrolase
MTKVEKQNPSSCAFCASDIGERIVATNDSVFAIEDKFPVTTGHLLIVPFRHTEDYFSLTDEERKHTEELLRSLKDGIQANDPLVTGFNVGMNCGVSAGQTVMHSHIHLIPRRNGDAADPRGGVRGVIQEKQKY